MHPTSALRRVPLLFALTLGLALPLLPSDPAHAEVTQGITGVVTGPGGDTRRATIAIEPVDPSMVLHGEVEFLWCDLLCDAWGTEADGSFSIALPPGEYWVQTYAAPTATEDLAPEWWQDSASRQGATKVVVTEGTLTALDPQLDPASTVSGTIAQAAGAAGAAYVEAWVADDTFPGGYHRVDVDLTDAQGNYALALLPTGTYLIRARIEQKKLEGWYGGATDPALSTSVPVTVAGSVVPDIDFGTLSPYSAIRGTVTSAATGPVADAIVRLFLRDASGWTEAERVTTAADGTYAAPAQSGTYKVVVHADGHLDAGLGGGPFLTSTRFSHVLKQDLDGIDVELTPARAVALSGARISGVPRVADTLTANAGTWYQQGLTYSYQWRSNGWPVPGATGKTYVVRPADVGRRIDLVVTASGSGVPAGSSTASTDTVRQGRFRLLSAASLTGTLSVGNLLTGRAPATSPAPARIRYQWIRDWRPISGATGRTYRLRAADRGHWIGLRITLTRPGFVTVVREPVRRSLVR